MKVIEKIYNSIKSDPKIQKCIDEIESYKWIKVIERD